MALLLPVAYTRRACGIRFDLACRIGTYIRGTAAAITLRPFAVIDQ